MNIDLNSWKWVKSPRQKGIQKIRRLNNEHKGIQEFWGKKKKEEKERGRNWIAIKLRKTRKALWNLKEGRQYFKEGVVDSGKDCRKFKYYKSVLGCHCGLGKGSFNEIMGWKSLCSELRYGRWRHVNS